MRIKNFPWTTVAVFIAMVTAIVVLAVTHNVSSAAFPTLITLLPVALTGAAYAENTNKGMKNGLVVEKTKQALEETGVTTIASQAANNTNAVMGNLLAQTQALQTLLKGQTPPEERNASVHG